MTVSGYNRACRRCRAGVRSSLKFGLLSLPAHSAEASSQEQATPGAVIGMAVGALSLGTNQVELEGEGIGLGLGHAMHCAQASSRQRQQL
jgi:hypothetical protein